MGINAFADLVHLEPIVKSMSMNATAIPAEMAQDVSMASIGVYLFYGLCCTTIERNGHDTQKTCLIQNEFPM